MHRLDPPSKVSSVRIRRSTGQSSTVARVRVQKMGGGNEAAVESQMFECAENTEHADGGLEDTQHCILADAGASDATAVGVAAPESPAGAAKSCTCFREFMVVAGEGRQRYPPPLRPHLAENEHPNLSILTNNQPTNRTNVNCSIVGNTRRRVVTTSCQWPCVNTPLATDRDLAVRMRGLHSLCPCVDTRSENTDEWMACMCACVVLTQCCLDMYSPAAFRCRAGACLHLGRLPFYFC